MSEQIGLPKGWVFPPIGHVCDLLPGYGFPNDYQGRTKGDLPFFKVGDISYAWQRHERYLTVAQHYINFDDAKQLRAKPLPAGTVVFAKIGAAISLNRRAILSQTSLIDNNCMGLSPLPGVVNQQFLFYFTCTLRLGESSRSSIVPSLRKSDVEPIQLPLPPFNEQRRIVAKIEELFSDLDAGVAALKRIKANLKRYRAAVLKAAVEGKLTEEWRAKHPRTEPATKLLERILADRRKKWEEDQLAKFAAAKKEPPKGWREKYFKPALPETSGLPDLPQGWCWANVEQTSDVQGGIQKQPKRTPQQNCFPFLRVANVYRNRLELGEVHQIELFGDELERLRLQPKDLLVVEGNGSKTEIGRSAIWNGEIENCVHQNHISVFDSWQVSPAILTLTGTLRPAMAG